MQKKTPAEVLGADIRSARLALGLTIAELAKRLGKREHEKGNGRLSRLENGLANPRINDLVPIAEALGRRLGESLGRMYGHHFRMVVPA